MTTMGEGYKVLIVDDEKSSRELIRMSIDWDEVGFEVIGEAANGEEALEFLEEHMADVVLTDIYMPYMDGIELSEQILSLYPDMKIIVISGHDDFEYAQRGIRLGVFDFILKPIDEDEIEHTLKSVHMAIQDERKVKEGYGWLKKELPYLKEKFLVELLYNHMGEQEYNKRKEFTEVEILSDQFQVAVIKILSDEQKEYDAGADDSYLCYSYRNSIRDTMEEILGVLVFIDNSNNIVLLNTNPENQASFDKRLEMIRHRLLSKPGLSLTIGLSGWHSGYSNIKKSYQEATEAIGYSIVSGMNQIITYKDMVVSEHEVKDLDSSWEKQLTLYVKGGIEEESIKVIEEVFEGFIATDIRHLKKLQLKAIRVLALVISAAAEIGLDIEDESGISEGSFEAVFKAHSLPEIKDNVIDSVKNVCHMISAEHNNKQHTVISEINDYVEDNIKEQLSLNIIAEAFHLNKSYLSRIYKERTGHTLGEFILKKRMEKGMSLIRNTQMKAYEIAEEVGYLDPNYFGNCFKKYTGKSISEFRKREP